MGQKRKLSPQKGNDIYICMYEYIYLLLSFRNYSPTPQSCFLHLSHWKSLHRQVGIVTSWTNDLYCLLKMLIFFSYRMS